MEPECEDNNDYENAHQEVIVDSFNSLNGSVNDTFEEEKLRINDNKELDNQIAEMIEKTEHANWKCKICGKIGTKKYNIESHAETHIEGLSFSCDVCRRTYSTRLYLRQHISKSRHCK